MTFTGFRGRLRSNRQRKRKKVRERRRKARRERRKRARIEKIKGLKERLDRRLLSLIGLKRKQILATQRIRRLKLLGNVKKLNEARNIKLLMDKRIHRLKREIHARKLRLRRLNYRLQASKRRAKTRRARKRAINILRMKERQALKNLKMLAQERVASAQTIAKLQRLKQYRLLAKMRAKQAAERKKIISQAQKRLRLLQRHILLRNKAMQTRLKAMKRRAERLNMLRLRIRSRQKRTNTELSKTRKMLNVVSQRMSYYRRLRNRYILQRLQYYKQYATNRARKLRLRRSRYLQQLAGVRKRRQSISLRMQRAAKRTREFQKEMRAFYKKEQQKLLSLLKTSRKGILG